MTEHKITKTLSPSRLSQYSLCPLKFWGQVSGQLVWKDSPAKHRGTEIHDTLAQSLNSHAAPVSLPEGVDNDYIAETLEKLRNVDILVEHELAVTRDCKPAGWWDEDCFLRAKADFIILSPEGQLGAFIGDWKTGKVYPGMELQLETEALLVYALYHKPVVRWGLFYVDQGITKKGVVDFTQGLAPVKNVISLAKECWNALEQGGPFPAKKNQFCRWCDWYHRPDFCSV